MPKKDARTYEQQTCSYDFSQLGRANANLCACAPDHSADLSHCRTLTNPWRNNLHGSSRAPHEPVLLAYIRPGARQFTREEQVRMIEAYCVQQGFRIAKTFTDTDKPSRGLQDALHAVEEHDGVDGLIAVNLNCFVEHESDRLRDLRPFIHHFFCLKGKHLITIQEGIDTGSREGQLAAVEVATQSKETF
jgi:hypothetical protein